MEGSTSCARSGRRAVKNSSARIFPEIYRRPFAPGDAVVHFGETRRKSRLGGRSSCAGGSHRRRTRTKTAIIAPIRQFPFCPISESRFRGRLVFDSVDDEAVVDFFAPAGATLGARPCMCMSRGAGAVACLPERTEPPTARAGALSGAHPARHSALRRNLNILTILEKNAATAALGR
jgi:hypothetical protein